MKILSNGKVKLQDYVKVCPYCECKFTFNESDERLLDASNLLSLPPRDTIGSYVERPSCKEKLYIDQVWDKCTVRSWSF